MLKHYLHALFSKDRELAPNGTRAICYLPETDSQKKELTTSRSRSSWLFHWRLRNVVGRISEDFKTVGLRINRVLRRRTFLTSVAFFQNEDMKAICMADLAIRYLTNK